MALMNGDAAPPQQEPTPSGGFRNQLLAQAEKKLEATLTPQNRQDYMKFVVAGMKVVLQGGPTGMMSKLTNSRNPLATATAGPVNLVLILARQSRGKPPARAMIPAMMTLMFHALDLLESQGKLQVTQDVLVQATKMFADNIMRAFNITQNQLNMVASKSHQIMSDPAAMQKVHQHAAAISQNGGRVPPQPAGPAPSPMAGGGTPLMKQ